MQSFMLFNFRNYLQIYKSFCNFTENIKLMAKIYKTYKYRMYPNKEQEQILARHFGSVRFVYNYFLTERKKQYDKNGKSDNYLAQAKTLTLLKKQEDFAWLNEINSQTLQFSLRYLETSYTNFFRGRAKFPRFKVKSMAVVSQYHKTALLKTAESTYRSSSKASKSKNTESSKGILEI